MNKLGSNRRFILIGMALLFASPGALQSLHYIGIHHQYHASASTSAIDTHSNNCLVHNFVLFSFLRETLLHYQQPHFSFEIMLTRGKVAPKMKKHIALIKTRGPPKNFNVM